MWTEPRRHGAASAFAVAFLVLVLTDVASAGRVVKVPRTGQTTSFRQGDDGWYGAGLPWPSPRFVVNADDTITDLLTGLSWAQDPSAGGAGDWQHAFDHVEAMNIGAVLNHGHRDWRLPNYNEIMSLAIFAGLDQAALLEANGFDNVHVAPVGTASFQASSIQGNFATGWNFALAHPGGGGSHEYAWPVRGISNGPARVPVTGQWDVRHGRDDADLRMGYNWSGDAGGRFAVVPCTSAGPGADADPLNDLMRDWLTGYLWPRDLKVYAGHAWDDSVDAAESLALCGFTDWRMPNANEMRTLLHHGYLNQADWLAFSGFVSGGAYYWWTSTHLGDGEAWVQFDLGHLRRESKAGLQGDPIGAAVLPVRSGVGSLHADHLLHDFGPEDVGASSAPHAFVVSNSSIFPVTSTSLTLTGDANDFEIVWDECQIQSVWDDRPCEIRLAFAPQSAGPKEAGVVLASDDPTSPLQVIVRGEGVVADSDGDGIPDPDDDCPLTPNADQADADGDDVGTACDPCPADATNTCEWSTAEVLGADTAWPSPSTRTIVTDQDGEPHVVFGGDHLVHAARDATGWQHEVVDPAAPALATLGTDGGGGVHVVYRTNGGALRYARKPAGGTWTIEDVAGAGTSFFPSVVTVLPDATVHLIGHTPTPAEVRHGVRPPGGAWSFEAVVTGESSATGHSSIAVDTGGAVHAAWYAGTSSQASTLRYAAKAPGAGWSQAATLDAGTLVGHYPSVGADDLGTVHVFYQSRATGTSAVRLASKPAGGSWSVETVATGLHPAMVVEPSGVVHLSFRQGDDLRYARRPPGGAWAFETAQDCTEDPNDAGTICGSNGSLAVAPGGDVHVQYTNQGTDTLVTHAWKSPGLSWSVEGIAAGSAFRRSPSIGRDGTGALHVAFYDGGTQDLRHAYGQPGGAFVVETVDAAGDVGRHASLVVDGADTTHVAYADATHGAIKHAAKPSGGGWSTTTVGYGGGGAMRPSLAATAGGDLHLCWWDPSTGQIRYASRPAGGAWNASLAPAASDARGGCAVGVSGAGAATIVYLDAASRPVALDAPAASWVAEPVAGGSAASAVTATIDGAGTLHVAYVTAAAPRKLWYATRTGGAWTLRRVATGVEAVGAPGVGVDAFGALHLAYATAGGDLALAFHDVVAGWRYSTVTRDVLGTNEAALGLDAIGRAAVAYFDPAGAVRYGVRAGPVTTTTTTLPPPATSTTTTAAQTTTTSTTRPPACTIASDCEPSPRCATGACVGGGCVYTHLSGMAGTDCDLAALLDPPACTAAPMDARLRRTLEKKVRRARALLDDAQGAPARKARRLVRRAAAQLAALRKSVRASKRTPRACRDALADLLETQRRQVLVLRF